MSMNLGDAVAGEAMKHVGKPYMKAPNNQGPNTFDCSGLVWYCYKQCGHDILERGSTQQASLGTAVSQANARPGDIVCYTYDPARYVSHTGIYVGDGESVEAYNEARGVILTPAFTDGYGNPRSSFVTVRRVVPYDDQKGIVDTIIEIILQILSNSLRKPQTNTYRVTTNLNLRSGMGTSHPVIGVLTAGSLVTKLEGPTASGGYNWFKVESPTLGVGFCVDSLTPA